jgi:hypothetical protein
MMSINIKSILIIILPIFLLSCGFKMVNKKNEKLIFIQNIIIEGEKRSVNLLKNNILLISDTNSKNIYEVKIEIIKKKENKIKNMSGRVTRYSLSLFVKLELKNLEDYKKINQTFLRSQDYNVAKVHSETISNESSATKNLIKQISSDIVSFITLSMRNK